MHCIEARSKITKFGEKIEIKSLDTIVDIVIHAKDVVSLRAVVGSYMRLVQTAYGCLCA